MVCQEPLSHLKFFLLPPFLFSSIQKWKNAKYWMHNLTYALETCSNSAAKFYAIEGLIVLWPLPSGRAVGLHANIPCRVQRKLKLFQLNFLTVLSPLEAFHVTQSQLTALLLSPPSWTLISCSWLYTLYNHFLSVPHSLFFFCPLKLDWISKAMMSSVALKCHLLQQLIQGFLCRLVN